MRRQAVRALIPKPPDFGDHYPRLGMWLFLAAMLPTLAVVAYLLADWAREVMP